MIEIFYDHFRLETGTAEDIEVKEDEQYEFCLKKIHEHAENHLPLKIFVRNRGMYGWFDSAKRKYGGIVKILDPVLELSKRLHYAPLPSHLQTNPDLIIQCNLLEKALATPSEIGESTENWTSRILVGKVWTLEQIGNDEQLVDLLAYFSGHEKPVAQPIITEIIEKRFQVWMNNSPKVFSLIAWLRHDPFQRVRYLVWEQLLSAYPVNRVAEWLQYNDTWAILSQFTNRKEVVPVLPQSLGVNLPPAISNYVKAFLETVWEQESPSTAISFISGKLDVEINFLNDRLRRRLHDGSPLDTGLCQAIIAVANNDVAVMDLAKQLSQPVFPGLINEHSSVSEVINWIKDEYLPFYRSCANLKQLDLTIESLDGFEKWLKRNYHELLVNGEAMAYRQIQTLKNRLSDKIIIIIMVDGLDYLTAQEYLLPALVENGLYPEQESLPYLSFIPSETHIAKPAILRGKMPSQIPDENSDAGYYKLLIQEVFNLNSGEVKSATDKDMTLEELVNEPAKVYLYLDNQLDREYLHSLFNPYLRQKKYAKHIRELVRSVGEAVSIAREVNGLSPLIVVCSDHGYTELPKNSQVILINAKSKVRSMMIADELSEMKDQVWHLQANLFGLNNNMSVPLKYGCFANMPRGAAHGGCTPQELAVPWIVASTSKPEPLMPVTISIEGDIHRRRKENPVHICLSNPNPYSITMIHLQLEKIDMTEQPPLIIAKQSVYKIPVCLDASAISENVIELKGHYSIKHLAKSMSETLKLKIPTTGAMAMEFDDDFDV